MVETEKCNKKQQISYFVSFKLLKTNNKWQIMTPSTKKQKTTTLDRYILFESPKKGGLINILWNKYG